MKATLCSLADPTLASLPQATPGNQPAPPQPSSAQPPSAAVAAGLLRGGGGPPSPPKGGRGLDFCRGRWSLAGAAWGRRPRGLAGAPPWRRAGAGVLGGEGFGARRIWGSHAQISCRRRCSVRRHVVGLVGILRCVVCGPGTSAWWARAAAQVVAAWGVGMVLWRRPVRLLGQAYSMSRRAKTVSQRWRWRRLRAPFPSLEVLSRRDACIPLVPLRGKP